MLPPVPLIAFAAVPVHELDVQPPLIEVTHRSRDLLRSAIVDGSPFGQHHVPVLNELVANDGRDVELRAVIRMIEYAGGAYLAFPC